MTSPLKPHQRESVDFVHLNNGRSIIALDPGMGKTLVALTYAKESNNFPMVVVCPATVKGTWKAEARKWLGDIPVHVMQGKSPEPVPPETKILVTSYNLLYPRIKCLTAFIGKTIVFDECHNLSNRQTNTTKSATILSRRFQHVIGLSGTPILNRPSDFWPILHIIRPKEYPRFQAFAWKYCDPRYRPWGWEYAGASNLEQLAEEIKPFVIRRKIDILADEMPERDIRMEILEIDRREEYLEAKYNFTKWMESKGRRLTPGALKAEKLIQVGFLLRLAAKLKCRHLVKFIREYREQYPEKKLLLFCHHNQLAEVLRRQVFDSDEPYLEISGSVPSGKRHPIVERFQQDPQARMIVCKTLSAGAGLTLTAASTSIFCELPWSASSMKQAAARNFRIGQDKHVETIMTVARDTIEYRVCKILEEKAFLHDTLIDGTSTKSLPLATLLAEELA